MAISRRRFLQLGTFSGAAALTCGLRGVTAANALEVTRTLVRLPGEGPRIKLALIGDVHAPSSGVAFDEVVRAVNTQEPDLILIVGDSFNRRRDVGLVEMYAPLRARVGKFASVGNWENWSLVRRSTLVEHYARAEVDLLDNDTTSLAELDVSLVGLDECTNGHPDWTHVAAASPGDTMVVMHHSPGAFDGLPGSHAGGLLMLSGHTHGGQVAPLGRPLVLPPGSRGYVAGHYGGGQRHLYVTRGLGNSHFPVRVGARPELAIVTVERTGA